MYVTDIYTNKVKSCTPDTDLATAGWLMWDGDCGALPVTDHEQRVIGVITDRDICMAGATRNCSLHQILVKEVATRIPLTCRPYDDVHDLLILMARNQVRRLPVVDMDGKLLGMLALNDVILCSRPKESATANDVLYSDVVECLQTICRVRPEQEQKMLPADLTVPG